MLCSVYVDFDGTIAPDEPTDALFDRFADPAWRGIEEQWQQGLLSSRECMSRQVALLRARPEEIDEFLRSVTVDQRFPDFVQVCRRRGARLMVVSDGLDRVVGTVLRNAGVAAPYFANRLKWKGDDRWQLEFPHARSACRFQMGNCKCGHRRRSAGSLEIMVGDGRSDFCLAEQADLVLARNGLAAHCERAGVPHVQIENFADATVALVAWLDDVQQKYAAVG